MEIFAEKSVKEKLRTIISEEFKIEPEDIADDSDIVTDIGADSADMISILFHIEAEFNVEVSNEEAGRNLTIQKMTNLLKGKLI